MIIQSGDHHTKRTEELARSMTGHNGGRECATMHCEKQVSALAWIQINNHPQTNF